MAGELQVIKDAPELSTYVKSLNQDDNAQAVLCELGGGLLKFAEAAFPDADNSDIYAQHNEREPEGRGAHFDVYGDYVKKEYQWIGIFNLAGKAAVSTLVLPPELASSYFVSFPEPDDNAFEARRHYSAIALMTPGAKILTGRFNPATGLVLPQRKHGPHIIHDVVPSDKDNPGKFVKLVVPSNSKDAKDKIKSGAYEPLDEFVTRSLGGELPRTEEAIQAISETRIRVPVGRQVRLPQRRRCNLD